MTAPDPIIRTRNRGNKRRGANWEIGLVNWFRQQGYGAERISRKGNRDEGDVAVPIIGSMGHYLIVEAKNAARLSLPEWLRQANEQAKRWSDARNAQGWPVVIIKRRRHGTDKAYVVMELDRFMELVG